MLVLSRIAGTSISIKSDGDACLITVLKILKKSSSVSLLISRVNVNAPGELESREIELVLGGTCRISQAVEQTVVDVDYAKARLGIVAPRESLVERLEVHQQQKDQRHDESDSGDAGARVPRPTSPKPPSLEVRLNEPNSDDE